MSAERTAAWRRWFRRKPRIAIEQHISVTDPGLAAMRRLTAIKTQPDGVDEAALVRKVADES